MPTTDLIQIDLDKVLTQKLGKKMRYVPRPLVSWLKRTIRQNELNEKLRLYHPLQGVAFCDAAKQDFGISITLRHAELLPAVDDARVIFVCNHPLGGMDGILLISELAHRYGDGVRVVVNDLLMAVQPLAPVFLPINKHGRQSRQAIEDINKAMEGDSPILVFPAGLVSRRGRGGKICDLDWHKMFVSKAVQYHRDVVPLFFDGKNSNSFYRLAQWRKRLGIKFNIEMLYLPSEALNCKGRSFTLTLGRRIPWQSLATGDQMQHAARIKETVYALDNQSI